ncbi:response regulator [Neorhizobium huautlense]|uniref:response regulator n=1 Tax=Neorhizobium huautlense TaxID=67774 RepID=UPI000CF851AE|nr:response regulator [Neorhizobium huautlense]
MTLRILVVEDEMTISLLVEDMLTELGHEVVDLAMRLKQAEEMAATFDIDLAILDVNLDGHKSFPVADILAARGIPFVFATGYGAAGIDPGYQQWPVITKPFLIDDLRRAVELLAPPPAAA